LVGPDAEVDDADDFGGNGPSSLSSSSLSSSCSTERRRVLLLLLLLLVLMRFGRDLLCVAELLLFVATTAAYGLRITVVVVVAALEDVTEDADVAIGAAGILC
jgi:hypothetical protein